MSFFPARPTPNRQASTASSTSSFSSPGTSLLTPAYATEFYDAPSSPALSSDGRLGTPTAFDGKRSASPRSPGVRPMTEIDRMAYTYALRVAALHSHLHPAVSNQPPPSPTSFASPPPSARRKSFSFRKAAPVSSSPASTPPLPPLPTAATGENKLPKEYLIELWGLLANEPGDAAWTETKRAFLSGIKKGSRNERGGNLRDVGVLLETFLACIPPQTAAHPHQTHFLHIVSTSLPASTHFSTALRPLSEKDRELLHRLRREVAGYILADPIAGKPSSSGQPGHLSPGISLGVPRPARERLGEMEETVGLIFGVGRDTLRADLEEILGETSLDELYITHIQASAAHLASLPSQTSTQRHRHAELSRLLSSLQAQHPHLARAAEPGRAACSSVTFFTPPRKMELYSAICDRAEENVTLHRRAYALVDECVKVWAVPGEEEREKEVEGLIIAWTRSVGVSSKDEEVWGKMLEDGVGDLCAGRQQGLGVGMDQLLSALLSMLGQSVAGMMGGGEGWGGRNKSKADGLSGPPVSLLPLLLSGNGVLLRQPRAMQKLDEVRDEVKGMAVGEYVQAVEWLMGGMGASGGAAEQAKGFFDVAEWIEGVVGGIHAKWGDGLGEIFSPAAIVLSKQLPLFFAELQMLDGGAGAGSDKVFGLYEVTGRLGAMWNDLCPNVESGFEIDAFFEPHVIAWMKETEASKVHEWVSRAVAMDRWRPEGDQHYSQSVVDLFEFIQQSLGVILHDLPLSPYKRALYLTDMSKTSSIAVTQYASTLQALFHVDMNPASAKPANMASELGGKLNDKIGGKAGSWLAKGQQAMKTLERKKVDGFVVPPAALVKVSNMGACAESLDDLIVAIKPEETARLTRTKTRDVDTAAKIPFTITIARGQNLLGKSQGKAADAFCVITSVKHGEKLIKTRTVLGVEDPRWDQSVEVPVTDTKHLELAVYDRSLVGKHDLIGTASLKLDPKAWTTVSTRDVHIPLQPRGAVHLRISMEGGSQANDIRANLASATRTLERTANDMVNEVVERMMEFVRDQLSARNLAEMLRPKDKKKVKVYVGDPELEASLSGVTQYLNTNFSTFSYTLTPSTRLDLQLKLWNRILEHLISLLVPPLSDRPSTTPPTPGDQVEIVLKWLQLLKAFFNAKEGGTEHGVKLAQLQAGAYKDIMMLGQYLDLPTPALKERAGAAVKGVVARGKGAGDDATSQAEAERMAEVLLRIVRTRNDTSDFLVQQVGALSKARMDRHAGTL